MNSQDKLDSLLDGYFEEARGGTSMTKVTRKSKLKRAAGGSAMAMARKNNDPMYKRYIFFNKRRIELKAKIMKKYQRRGMAQARRTMGKSRKR